MTYEIVDNIIYKQIKCTRTINSLLIIAVNEWNNLLEELRNSKSLRYVKVK